MIRHGEPLQRMNSKLQPPIDPYTGRGFSQSTFSFPDHVGAVGNESAPARLSAE